MLALKCPEVRPHMKTPAVTEEVREMCEQYSQAVIYLRKLRSGPADQAEIDEMNNLMKELEGEIVHFIHEFAKHV
ncbi:hypothetical protein QTL95_10275 [Rhizobium sp. S152]|uniref:hypothetical protein n=1 Tax=Rhizobium sp. S152 TaxID=3055038 RepID=UPI0025A9817F|nr:hypothetical protein [Rhizobium sp. S152]MDM9626284.1 hypothetical protein [Rhizobium sp. S152]